MVRTKRTKIVATRHVSPAQNIPKLRLRPGLRPRPWWGSLYSFSPDILSGFKGPLRRRGERVEWTLQEKKGWRGKGGGRLCFLLQEFLLAPIVSLPLTLVKRPTLLRPCRCSTSVEPPPTLHNIQRVNSVNTFGVIISSQLLMYDHVSTLGLPCKNNIRITSSPSARHD